MRSTQVRVNLEVFPLSVVESALYAMSERIDGRIGRVKNGRVSVCLRAVNELNTAEMERDFNQALVTASVNEHAFRRAAPIRDYLAQTAFSITSQNQLAIDDFVSSMVCSQPKEHRGASPSPSTSPPPTNGHYAVTGSGNRWLTDEDNGEVVVWLDSRLFSLPDALWAANEMRCVCVCSINYLPGNRLTVMLKPGPDNGEPADLVRRFEQWLVIARDHCQ